MINKEQNAQNQLTAISPIDGRYFSKTKLLAPYFSEFGLIKYRVTIEIEYLLSLTNEACIPLHIDTKQADKLKAIITNFSLADAQQIKDIEKTTNHDVKAVEYFLKEKAKEILKEEEIEFIHFGLTSQDINNSAIPLSIKDALQEVVFPEIAQVISDITTFSKDWKDIPMLARTHGQPASPTKLGKEFKVFAERLTKQFDQLKTTGIEAKFGGATGNLNAHYVAYPETDWNQFANKFMDDLGLLRQQTTTQIEHYDQLGNLFNTLTRICTILIDYCRDIWTYVSMEYFKQKLKDGEIGSSAMPHKVNPIDFENAEGNLGLAIALFNHLANKLPISRQQRDLTDSTVLRNIGVPIGHLMISLASIIKGNGKLLLNVKAVNQDLENNWIVVAEAIQTVLRSVGYPKPYEALKDLTRTNKNVGSKEIKDFILNLDVDKQIKARLLEITPQNYTGNA